MKKVLVILIVMALLGSFASCGAPAEEVAIGQSTPEETQEETPAEPEELAEEAADEPAGEPAEEQEQNEDAAEEELEPEKPQISEIDRQMVEAILNNPQELFGEGAVQMTENEGGQFGSGISVKQPGDGCFQFVSEDDGAYMPFNTRLMDFDGGGNPQQAFSMRFMPNTAENLSFTMMGMGEIVISFESDGAYCTYVQAVEKTPIDGYMLEQGKWYNIVLATDENAALRVIVWEDGNDENHMYYERDLFIGTDDIFESNWKITLGFYSNSTLNVSEYSVYTFDSLVKNSQ